MKQLLSLFTDRARESRVRMSQCSDADAREQVDVLSALRVYDARPLATDENDRQALVHLQNVLRLDALHCL